MHLVIFALILGLNTQVKNVAQSLNEVQPGRTEHCI